MRTKANSFSLIFAGCVLLGGPLLAVFPEARASDSPEAVRQTAKEAYLYAYAMFKNYSTIYKQAVDPKAPEYHRRIQHVQALL